MAKDGNLLRISQGGGGGSASSDSKRHENAEDDTKSISVLTLY